jgi:murein L,D-transpeptidase YcbB/YkuD
MNYETPQLHGTLTYLVLNPLWNVPHSIAIRETYYQALKDPSYLLRNNYKVYVKDSLVNPLSVEWSKVNPEKIPFRFVQGAGRGNALGRIKFMFYNDFDVYLHDTPKRMPFRNASRAVSHGCVRIEEPMAFVKFLLEGHSTWNPTKIQAYLNQTQEGKIVFLERKVPIFIDYVTAWVDEAGRIQLREDVYGKDRVLKEAFAKAMDR